MSDLRQKRSLPFWRIDVELPHRRIQRLKEVLHTRFRVRHDLQQCRFIQHTSLTPPLLATNKR
jgi:hypothetical protein